MKRVVILKTPDREIPAYETTFFSNGEFIHTIHCEEASKELSMVEDNYEILVKDAFREFEKHPELKEMEYSSICDYAVIVRGHGYEDL